MPPLEPFSQRPRIFIVEDEVLVAMDLAERLDRMGYEVCGRTARGEQALVQIPALAPNVVLMDIRLAGEISGIETARRLRKAIEVPVIFLTAYADSGMVDEAIAVSPYGYLVKPFEERELHAALRAALYQFHAEQLLRFQNERLESLVAERSAALRESEEKLAITLNSIADGVVATDEAGRVSWLNPVAERFTGWSAVEAAGQPVDQVICLTDETTGAPVEIPLGEVLQTGRVFSFNADAILSARNGSKRSVAGSVAPISEHKGRRLGVVIVFRDQTWERTAQRILNERERLLTSIHHNLEGSFVYRFEVAPDGDLQFQYVSPNIEDVAGLRPETCRRRGEALLNLFPPDEAKRFREAVGGVAGPGARLDVEVALRHAVDGRSCWVRFRARGVERQADGRVVIEGLATDVTATRDAEAETRKLALVASRTDNAVVLTDASARIEWVNDGFTRLTGYTLEEVRGRVPGHFLQGPETDPAVVEQLRTALREGRGMQVELVNYSKSGRRYWIEMEIQPVPPKAGETTRFMALERDITARKDAEAEIRRLNADLERLVEQRTRKLAQSEERFRRLAENMRDLLCLVDTQGCFAYLSPSFEPVLGYRADELLGRDAFAEVHPDHRRELAEALRRVLAGHPGQLREFRFRHRAGHYVWLEAVGSGLERVDGTTVQGCVVTARDVTERHAAAERLLASEQRYSRLVENINDAIVREDVAGRIVFANRRFLEWFGLEGRPLEAITVADYVAPDWQTRVRERHQRLVRGEPVPARFEYEGIGANGRRVWLEVFATTVEEGGALVGIQSVIRNATARKQAELATQGVLSKTATVVGESFFRTLAQELAFALGVHWVCIARAQGPTRVQPLASCVEGRLVPLEESEVGPEHPCHAVLQRGETIHVPDGMRARYAGGIFGRLGIEGFLGVPIAPGREQPHGLVIIADTKPLRLDPLLLSLVNILALRADAEFMREAAERERSEMQARLFQGQKYEALGTLAGGVAHDFNNILTGVINFTMLAQMDCLPSQRQIRDYLGEVLKCGQRAKDLVRQILLFSRSESAELQPLRLQTVVHEALSLLRSSLPASIEIQSYVDPEAPVISGNATQIHQVIMNLGINAAQAMTQQKGTLAVVLEPRLLDEAAMRHLPGLQPGPHVAVVVRDDGCGMEPAVLERVFEPFFTTKKPGEGTGLGLAVVHSIVRTHRGCIRVESQPGKGTTFEIFFPIHHRSATAGDGLEAPELPRGRGQHLLLLDDEVAVGESTKLMLERLGYRVSVYSDPEIALAQFWAEPDRFDAVISDLQMSGITGDEFSRRLLERRPDLPVFLASGYWGKFTPERLRLDGVAGTFHKPIDLPEVAAALARLAAPRESIRGGGVLTPG